MSFSEAIIHYPKNILDFYLEKKLYGYYFWAGSFLFLWKSNLTISLNYSFYCSYICLFYKKWKKIFDIFCFCFLFATLFVFRYKKNLKVFLFFCFSYFVIWYFTIDWSEYFTIIPIFNAIITSYLSFFHTWFKLRIWICLTFIVRIVYSVSSHSIWWVTSDVVLFISWAIWAIKIKKDEILLKKKVDN